MLLIKNANLLLRLILELCVLVSVGYWGFHIKSGLIMKWISGIGAPIIIMIVWGTFIAPNSAYQLPLLFRLSLEFVVFAIGAYTLWASGAPNLAKTFSILVIINIILLLYWKQ